MIDGPTQPRTTYKVTIGGALRDDLGQTLGKNATVSFAVGDSLPSFLGQDGMTVLDPMATPALSYLTTNYDHLAVKLYRVDPSDYGAYHAYLASDAPHPQAAGDAGRRYDDEARRRRESASPRRAIALDKALHGGHRPRPRDRAGRPGACQHPTCRSIRRPRGRRRRSSRSMRTSIAIS